MTNNQAYALAVDVANEALAKCCGVDEVIYRRRDITGTSLQPYTIYQLKEVALNIVCSRQGYAYEDRIRQCLIKRRARV